MPSKKKTKASKPASVRAGDTGVFTLDERGGVIAPCGEKAFSAAELDAIAAQADWYHAQPKRPKQITLRGSWDKLHFRRDGFGDVETGIGVVPYKAIKTLHAMSRRIRGR